MHTIRLRAPWRLQRQGEAEVWQRAFGCPTNVSQQEVVRLVLYSERAQAAATLNGQVLGLAPAVYNVTHLLKPRNLLVLSVLRQEASQSTGGVPPFDVRLEIDSRLSQDNPVAK